MSPPSSAKPSTSTAATSSAPSASSTTNNSKNSNNSSSSNNNKNSTTWESCPDVWHPSFDEKDSPNDPHVILYEGKGNAFHLSSVVRKYTGARISITGNPTPPPPTTLTSTGGGGGGGGGGVGNGNGNNNKKSSSGGGTSSSTLSKSNSTSRSSSSSSSTTTTTTMKTKTSSSYQPPSRPGGRPTVSPPPPRRQFVKISMNQLYDALGLLRSLQYDVGQFNSAMEGGGSSRGTNSNNSAAAAAAAATDGTDKPKEDTPKPEEDDKDKDKDQDEETDKEIDKEKENDDSANNESESAEKTTTTTTAATTTTNKEKESISSSWKRYRCFRLLQQASAFGVRMPDDGKTKVIVRGLDGLISYLERHYAERIESARCAIDQTGMVDFDGLQEFFRPGRVVTDHGAGTGHAGVPTLMKVRACFYSRAKGLFGIASTFHVALECVVSTGDSAFAVVESQFTQSEFAGSRPIRDSATSDGGGGFSDMFTIPTRELMDGLTRRGRAYETICTDHHPTSSSSSMTTGTMVEYTAGSFLPTAKGSLRSSSGGGSMAASASQSSRMGSYGQASRTGGRMMVDTVASWQRGVHCAGRSGGIASDAVVATLRLYAQRRVRRQQQRAQAAAAANAAAQGSDSNKGGAAGGASGTYNDAAYSTSVQTSADGEGSMLLLTSGDLPDELAMLTWPVVPGFSLHARCWGVALVQGLVHPVTFNETAFDTLVMSDERKKLIRALVTMSSSSTDDDDNKKNRSPHPIRKLKADVIAGKGEGSIFLLHGPPGVGKTLTAEAIAELLHKPLYIVSMGELGTSPETLEERLQDVLDLCVPWKALILIDEAEMLLERRTKNDLVRNAMVCVMLRLLEYHSGTLFLTTNRVESLDPAFQSRVTCALRYDPLSESGRREVWYRLMDRMGLLGNNADDADADADGAESSEGDDNDVNDHHRFDLDELAKAEINGRQIKNALQLAVALSTYENVELSQEHLRATLDITSSFLRETTTKTTDE